MRKLFLDIFQRILYIGFMLIGVWWMIDGTFIHPADILFIKGLLFGLFAEVQMDRLDREK